MLALWSAQGGAPDAGAPAAGDHVPAEVDPASLRLPHLAGLDGLRGLSLVAVLLFHGGIGWASGGFLGVTAFFTLSGFLITSLLLLERQRTGRIDLRAFWARRARRLVPAAILCLLLAAAYAALLPEPPAGLVGDAAAAATWVANWRFIVQGTSYAATFADPSPLQHLWSLAVEEQVYVVVPLLAVALLGWRGRAHKARLVGALVVAVAASTWVMSLVHVAGTTSTRAYYGTDARAAEPLLGALLACALIGPAGLRRLGRRAVLALDVAAALAVVALAALCATTRQLDDGYYRGGFLGAAALAGVVLAAASQQGSLTGRALGLLPLRWLGTVSYGAYLFHWPVFLYLDDDRTGLSGLPLLALRLVVVLPLAAASHALVEQPVRRGALPGRAALVGWANGTVGALGAVAAAILLVPSAAPTAVAATGSPSSDVRLQASAPGPSTPTTAAARAAAVPGASTPATNAPAAGRPGGTALVSATPSTTRKPTRKKAPPPKAFTERPAPQPAPPAQKGALRVAFVGDSVAGYLAFGAMDWQAERDDVVVYNVAMGGCPLSRGGTRRLDDGHPFPIEDHCGFWSDPTSPYYKNLMAFDPQVIVVQDGINESVDRKIDDWERYKHTGDPEYDVWLLDELRSFIRAVAGPTDSVIYLNSPCADMGRYEHYYSTQEQTRRSYSLNARTYNLLAADSRVTVADLMGRICPKAGAYQDEMEGVPDGRPDGVHPSRPAALALMRNWLGPMILEAGKGAAGTPTSGTGSTSTSTTSPPAG